MSYQSEPIAATHPHPAPAGSAAPPAQTIIIKQNGGWLRLIMSFGFGFVMLCLTAFVILGSVTGSALNYYDTTGGITEKYYSGSKSSDAKIAIIKVTGVIMEGEGYVRHQINKIRNDDSVKAIVVRIDTPGGTVTGSDYIFHHLKKLRDDKKLPMVVSMGSMATSGGYYVAMAVGDQEKSIYAEPTTTTGSIGVIMPHYDLTGLMDRFDIVDDSIVTHDNKQLTSMTRELTPQKREILQRYINQSFDRFKNIVKEGRPIFAKDPAALDALATGEIFSAPIAKDHGLVDEIGFVEDAIARAAELAGLSTDEATTVEYNAPPSLFGDISLIQSRGSSSEVSLLVEMSVPRAYYLTTTLPLLMSTDRLRP